MQRNKPTCRWLKFQLLPGTRRCGLAVAILKRHDLKGRSFDLPSVFDLVVREAQDDVGELHARCLDGSGVVAEVARHACPGLFERLADDLQRLRSVRCTFYELSSSHVAHA